jgi:hypothetical protein
MELTPQILNNRGLMRAWVQDRQRALFDNDHPVPARVRAGRELVQVLATMLDDVDEALPAGRTALPPEFDEKWAIAFSDVDAGEQLSALEDVYGALSRARLAREGDAILRRTLDL